MLTEEKVIEMLSKSEVMIYEYIKKQAEANGGSMKESMKDIGKDSMGDGRVLSEATVHRAIRKLRKQGIIGIVPSVEKAEANEIVYFGVPEPDKQATDIFKMIGELSSSANRFEAILKAKETENDQLMRDKEILYERIDQLEMKLKQVQESDDVIVFSKTQIVSSQLLEDGITAYIVKTE